MKLLLVYSSTLKEVDRSFISQSVNTFNFAFESMINKFKKAGIDFYGVLPEKFIDSSGADSHDFLRIPEFDNQ